MDGLPPVAWRAADDATQSGNMLNRPCANTTKRTGQNQYRELLSADTTDNGTRGVVV
jgi:hypothetical protein